MTSVTRALGAIGDAGAAASKKTLMKQGEEESARVRARIARKNTGVMSREITPVNLEAAQPRKKELNPALLLDIMHRAATLWARWETPQQADVATLWAASTWMTDLEGKMLFDAHGRLFYIAPPGSGKTRSMKVIGAMTSNPTGIVKAPVTAYGLRNALEQGKTIRLDEIDRQMGAGRAHMDVQSVISAYERDTASLDGQSGGANEHSLFGPMMLAAKPRILTHTGGWLEDLFERSFIMTPAKHADQNDPIPDLDDQFGEITGGIQKVMPMWAQQVRPAEGLLRPIHSIPKALTARNREISASLLAVADRAVDPELMEANGSDVRWALRAREAVQSVLLGHGRDGAEIISDLSERMKGIGA
jgi:hypothetical protein